MTGLKIRCTALLGLLPLGPASAEALPGAGMDFFESRIRPVLIDRCYACHSAGADKVRGGLMLDTRDGWSKGGDYGPAIVPGDPEASLLIRAIRHTDPELQMPPKEPLNPQQIADFEDWVRMGAPDPRVGDKGDKASSGGLQADWRRHWAFQPVARPAVPEVEDDGWVKNEIDAFVLAALEAEGMRPSPPAGRRDWLRRVTYDVTGLPPTPVEMEEFVGNESADAEEEVVDRLLASPRYGERWGRYWLDVARYADTKGYVFQEERRYPFAHTYRDYVIESLNADKPYDRFVLEQLAADQLELGEDNGALAALGYLTLGRRFLNNNHDIIDDRIDVVFRGLQGLTVSCARCHDHKFEPIPTQDYYSLYGVFASSEEPDERPVLERAVDPETQARYIEERARLQAALDEKTAAEIAKFTKQVQDRRADYEAAADAALAEEGGTERLEKLSEERNLVLEVLQRATKARKAGEGWEGPDPFELSVEDVRRWAEVQISEATAKQRIELAELEIQHPGAPVRAMVLVDKPEAVEPVVFVRGNPGNRGPVVPRQLPEILGGPERKPFRLGSGRLEMAQAIASANNPLTARVMVNRVWLGHFGQGLVRTPSDLGLRTVAPRHRMLLDYLADRFMESGWSLKRLHRLILLSNTYRQAADHDEHYATRDPGNELLWRMNRRRLDFEALRDTLLVAGGNLDLSMGGRAVEIDGNDPAPRRTVYAFIDRQNLPGLFRTFDFANPDVTSPQRFSTTVPQQALYLMNSVFVARQAGQLTNRPDLPPADHVDERIRAMYRLVYQREPEPRELELGTAFVRAQSAQVPLERPGPAWRYGFGEYDACEGHVTNFVEMEHYAADRWQPASEYPAPQHGHLALKAGGGHPGGDNSQSAIRRWVAPVSGAVAIEGKVEHPSDEGDGVRALVVHSRRGELGRWEARHTTVDTTINEVMVEAGDVVDFVVEPGDTASHDSFNWAPRIRLLDGDRFELIQTVWSAAGDFGGPDSRDLPVMGAWARYAHVLLQSNELAFLD